MVLPGEYVDQIYTDSTTLAPAVLSYESATSFPATPSNLWSVIIPPIFTDTNGAIVDGFTVQSAYTITYADGTALRTPAFRMRSPISTVIQNSTFTGFKLPGTISSGDLTSAQILGNTFSNFVISSSVSCFNYLIRSDTAAVRLSGTGRK